MIQSIPTSSGVAPSGAVGGASNLTTAGAVPFVTSAGVLTQDSSLTWGNVNKRLLLGVETGSTNSSTRLAIVGGANSYGMAFKTSGVGTNMYLGLDSAAIGLDISNNAGTGIVRFVNGTSNILVGGTTDGNYKLDVQNSGSSGTLRVKDQTAVSGSTSVLIDIGAAQTAASTVLTISGGIRFNGTNTTGAGSALLGANSPAVTNTAPYTWIRATSSDGSTVYIPAWK